jgi:hypothetical protein
VNALTPGLYRATVRGFADVIMVVDQNGMCHHDNLLSDDGVSTTHSNNSYVTDARLLIVLDLDDSDVRYLASYLRNTVENHPNTLGNVGRAVFTAAADQIEAQTKSPKPEEPQGIGATVLASQVGECDGSERTWVRFRLSRTECWIDSLAHIRDWSDLEGVTT